MQIQVLSTSVETKPTAKGSYQQLEVAYKNLTFGKVESKKLMSFGANAEAFKQLATAQPASVWEVESVKNDKGYLDWVKVSKSSGVATGQPTSTTGTVGPATTSTVGTTKGGWETPEERAKKQVYIIRQSSLSTAVEALKTGAKVHPNAKDVIEYAKQLEAFVFGDTESKVAAKDVGTIETMEEDLPF